MRKRSNLRASMGDNALKGKPIIIDLENASPISEINGHHISKHRSCWVHILACQKGSKRKRLTEKEKEGMRERFERTSPCFLGMFPCRERSKKRINFKNRIVKAKNKLDSHAFDCYLEKLWWSFSEDTKTSFTYLDCLYFHLYLKTSSRAKVLTWIKEKHIFSKKYVFVPIVCWHHWSLLIFCHFGERLQSKTRTPCMLLLDSLEMANPKRLEPNIRKFVGDIYKAEGRKEKRELISQIPLLLPKVPQQRDGEECGKFVLYFISLFVECAPENFSMLEGHPCFKEQNWFKPEVFECFCKKLEFF